MSQPDLHRAQAPATNDWLRPELIASWREIILVVLVMIGPFAWHSGVAASGGSSATFISSLLSDRHLLTTLTFESVQMAFFLWLLHRRGWRPSDFRIFIGWWSSLQALFLLGTVEAIHLVVMLALFTVIFLLQANPATFLAVLLSNSPHLLPHSVTISWTVLLAAMILNAFFEELTCTGYVFNQLAARKGPLFALLLTVLLRMSCHTYQGPVACLGIGAVFLVFGTWYWFTRNLWPLILAHALLDIGSTAFIKILCG